MGFISLFICESLSFSSNKIAFPKLCVLSDPNCKQVRSPLFIWEESESHKPSCWSSVLQSPRPSFKYVWHLCSPYKRLVGRSFCLTSKIKAKASENSLTAWQRCRSSQVLCVRSACGCSGRKLNKQLADTNILSCELSCSSLKYVGTIAYGLSF